MVTISFDPNFEKVFFKIKDKAIKERIIKQFIKVKENPEIGKPMMYTRKGTREVYVSPFRLSYLYLKELDKIIFVNLYHKDEQ